MALQYQGYDVELSTTSNQTKPEDLNVKALQFRQLQRDPVPSYNITSPNTPGISVPLGSQKSIQMTDRGITRPSHVTHL